VGTNGAAAAAAARAANSRLDRSATFMDES
jgi:hypothetical protein